MAARGEQWLWQHVDHTSEAVMEAQEVVEGEGELEHRYFEGRWRMTWQLMAIGRT